MTIYFGGNYIIAFLIILYIVSFEHHIALDKVTSINRTLDETLNDLDRTVNDRTMELQNINKELSDFTYSITHDLRAPLRSMQGFSSVLQDEYNEKLDESGMQIVNRIAKSAEKMDKMILDLLVHSKISQENTIFANLSLEKCIKEVIRINQDTIEQNKVKIDVKLPLQYVKGSQIILNQVINNLISNAIKFTDKIKDPKVIIWSVIRDDMIRLYIEDNGIGIEEQYFDKIFNVFEKLHTTEYPGTGIGLAIVKRGIEKMGGRSGVESKVGKFSRFWFELPTGHRV